MHIIYTIMSHFLRPTFEKKSAEEKSAIGEKNTEVKQMLEEKNIPFSMNIPVSLGHLKLTFLVAETMMSEGCSNYYPGAHNHGDYELRYVAKGNSVQHIEGEKIETTAGDLLLILPRKYHFQLADAITENLVQYSIRFSIKPPLDSSSTASKRSYSEIIELLSENERLKDEEFILRPLFERISKEILEKQYGYFNYLQALCSTLMIEFIRLSKKTAKNLLHSEELKYTGYWRNKIDRFFYRGYMNNIKLQDLADAIKVSRRHASRLVQREFGVTYVAKLMEVRLEQAKYQLAYTDKDLFSISVGCGFSSYSYFTTCFKKATGMTPSEYRAKNSAKK